MRPNCHDGGRRKKYLAAAANAEGILRVIQSMPSPKAESLKAWLARGGSERIEETIHPELAIDRALDACLKKGCAREWIIRRLPAMQARKELTDEWDNRGVKKGVERAIMTDEKTKARAGLNARQHKNLKGLKKESLRGNMSTLELVLNMLAEATTATLSRKQEPKTLDENVGVARQGGGIAGDARKFPKPTVSSRKTLVAKNPSRIWPNCGILTWR
ncbi:MAG: hypothetical protein LBJ64_06485 [Deltaproteobacteria bacterium]|nr:hypothetical protein [Deltaproteobacteria bacterium]